MKIKQYTKEYYNREIYTESVDIESFVYGNLCLIAESCPDKDMTVSKLATLLIEEGLNNLEIEYVKEGV